MKSFNILFMGTSSFAVPILKELVNKNQNISKVFSSPPKKANRGMKSSLSPVASYAKKMNLPLEFPDNLKDENIIEMIKELKLDMIIVIAYGFIIPKEILSIPKYGCFNLHASLLPRWRGAAPIQRSIIKGDKITGISFIKINEGLDTGDIVLSKSIEIEDKDNYLTLSEKLAGLGAQELGSFLKIFENNISLYSQDEKDAIYAEKILKAESRINWNETAELIVRRIRAYSPNPGAWINLNGKRVKILKAEVVDGIGIPGNIINKDFHIACGEKSIKPLILKKEGKNETDIDSFLRGNQIKVDDSLN